MFSTDEKKVFADALEARLRKRDRALQCPMCSDQNFTLADAYIRNELQENLSYVSIGGKSIPAIALICNNCGFLSQHAIGALGLLPKKESDNES